jgi:hypothetical protein
MKSQGKSDLDEDEGKRYAAQACDVAQDEPCTEQDDAGLQPEIVGGDSAPEERGDADRIGDDETNQNGPQNIFDIGQYQVVGFAVARNELLNELAAVTDRGKQEQSRHEAKPVAETAR